MDAKCPECEKVAVLDDEITKVKCPHCNFEADYEKYLEQRNYGFDENNNLIDVTEELRGYRFGS